MIRNKIWYNLVNSKFKCYYIGYLIRKFQRRSIIINSFLAIISISSVSAWVIWEIVPGLWALLIAGSNVLIAIKPFLHYDKRVKELHEKLNLLESIEIDYEKLFFELDSKRIDSNIAADQFFSIYQKQIQSLRTSDDLLFSIDKDCNKKADRDTNTYIFNNYNIKSKES